jgi:hypothetical protein
MAVRPVWRAAEPCDVIQDGRGDLDPAAVPGPGQRILGVKAAGLPPLEWYDALLELGRAGADGLRPLVPRAMADLLAYLETVQRAE